jgi:hypothetical protein
MLSGSNVMLRGVGRRGTEEQSKMRCHDWQATQRNVDEETVMERQQRSGKPQRIKPDPQPQQKDSTANSAR